MKPQARIHVINAYPEGLEPLEHLTGNLYWTWDRQIRELLRSLDPTLWKRTNHSPLKTLAGLSQKRLEQIASDAETLERVSDAVTRLNHYLQSDGWFSRAYPDRKVRIAYFSAEYGIHESVPLYSGGLGVLSGDHTKSASDLDVPMVCVGLLYQMGYFSQRLSAEGAQSETYEHNRPSTMPIRKVLDESGAQLRTTIALGTESVVVALWRMDVGRIPVYLLDTNLPENRNAELRNTTGYLYGGDQRMRILQEIVLGIGGMRLLWQLGIVPEVTHCNEGHSAFLLLERARLLMEALKLSRDEAIELVRASSVFTTHTPVPAGHDVFPEDLVRELLSGTAAAIGLDIDGLMRLGRVDPDDASEGLSMTVLALRLCAGRNGVSALHGEVSRQMWHSIWPEVAPSEAPITHVTNGVHPATFLSDRMSELLDRHLPTDWRARVYEPAVWEGIAEVPDRDLWDTKRQMRLEMIEYLRRRMLDRQSEMYSRSETGRRGSELLDPDCLTIGFARRFASYKRATLLFRDRDRAWRLFSDEERPIQLVIAGKAHPRDELGKKLIREIYSFVRDTGLEHRIVFVEDYDIGVARAMVSGCDVWLNNPRRPMEASGTSGMKAVLNGTINLSILDGWYPEAYDGRNGFAIGTEREFIDEVYQDEIESRDLYKTLETEVIPVFFDRPEHDLPKEWIAMQKHAFRTMAARFSSHRMVQDYVRDLYLPAADRYDQLTADGAGALRDLVSWKSRVLSRVDRLGVHSVSVSREDDVRRGSSVGVEALVSIADLSAEDVAVEAFVGLLDEDGGILEGEPTQLHSVEKLDNGLYRYSGEVRVTAVGETGITVRISPQHRDLPSPADLHAVVWA